MTNEIIGMVISLLGMTANVVSFQMNKKKALLMIQMIGGSLFMLSYLFAGGGIGAIINAICLVRSVLFMRFADRKKAMNITIAGLSLACVAGYFIYIFAWMPQESSIPNKLWSILPVLGALIGNIAFSLQRLNLVRIIKVGDSACWLAYNAYIGLGALGGILCEIFSLCSIVIGLIRFRGKANNEKIHQENSTQE